ncbi:MAG: DUF1080 domain-containing protein [Capsulimonadales bacterium]|nr:DUF1080 domain-containing protein [Capsulimonadales bacterium]
MNPFRRPSVILAALAVVPLPLATLAVFAFPANERQEAFPRQEPKDDNRPPHPIPTIPGVVVLFSGKPEEVAANWRKNKSEQDAAWTVENGAMVARGGDIVSKREFSDFQLHVEFKLPYEPNATGQGRGNSGVGLQSRYEIQVLNSFGWARPGKGDGGALYNQAAPLVNAALPPRQWQTYDIVFRAPKFDAEGKQLLQKARVTVYQNGVCIHNNQEIDGPTGIGSDRPIDKPGPIFLQDHGHPVHYRNIWVLPLPDKGSEKYESTQ